MRAGGVTSSNVAEGMCFCSSGCEKAFVSQLAEIVPFSMKELSSWDAGELLHGAKRITSACDAALKRNDIAARRLRAVAMRRRSGENALFSAIDEDICNSVIASTTQMLNVDVGLLLAARKMAESKLLIKKRMVPPLHLGWRANSIAFGFPLSYVRNVYLRGKQRGREEPIISSKSHVMSPPRWLKSCIDNAVNVFPLAAPM